VIAPSESMSESELDSPGRITRFANAGFIGDDDDSSIRFTFLFLIRNEGDFRDLGESAELDRPICIGGEFILPCPFDETGGEGTVSDADF